MQIAWDPWKGCRVGEAKNPGPGASAATSRKRAQKLHPPDSNPESELAQQLMQVLNNFSGKQAQSSHAAESLPPARKGKGGPVPVKHTSLIHSLYQILQSAVDNQWSDDQIVSRLTTKLSKVGNSTAESDGAQPARQVRFQDEEFPPLRPGPKSSQNTRPDLSARPTRPGKPAAVQSPKGGKPQVSHFADLHRTRNVETSRPTKARFAAKVLDHEWSGDPIITSIPRILSALKDGKVIPGNLVISGDEQVAEELKQIWSAYDLSDDMTVGIIAPPNSVGPSLSLWWSLDRKRALPYRYKLHLHQLADFEGPTPKPPQLLQLMQTQGPKLVTLRILVPWHYRQHVAGVDQKDAPASVIAELAQLLQEPVTRQRKPLPSESLTAPRKRWTHTQASVITLNSDTEEPPIGKEDPSGDSAGKGSHTRKKSKTGHDSAEAAQALKVQFPQWSSKDDGGSGDCGFRAVARALACQQGKDLTSDKLVSEASRLRTLTVGHLTSHKDRFSGFWAMDPDARPEQRDHMNEPETFSDYIMAASRKNWWIDGLLLHALAHRLGRVIIIFVWHSQDGAWQRHVVAPTHENGIAKGSKDSVPICLLLSNEHYCSLLPNDSDVNIPQEWLRSTPEVARQVLRGAGKSRSNSSQLSLPASPASSHSIRQWCKPRGSQEDASSQTAQNPVRALACLLARLAENPVYVQILASKVSKLSLAQAYSGVAPASAASVSSKSPRIAAKRPRSWHRTQVGQLWWTCDQCDFKVYWVEGVSSHSDARRQHLIQIHGVAPKDIPKHAPPKPAESLMAQYYKRRWSALLDICSARAWPGMHRLVRAKHSWKCSKCNSGRILSSHVAAQICPAFEGNPKSIPSLATRERLWGEWNNEAQQQVHVPELEARTKRVQLRRQNKVARQAAWDADQKCTPVKQFRGLSVLKADRGDQTWWHCGLCEFTVKYNHPRRSDAKAKHLRDVHGSSNISLNPGKNDALANPARIVKTVEALQARWQRLHNLIKDGPWPGAHCLNAEAAYYRSYQASKTGKTWTRAMYLCNKCGMHVCLSDFVTAACKSTGVLPPLKERKERWKALRKQAVQRTKPEPKSRRNHPARGVRIGEAKNPGPRTRGRQLHDHTCKLIVDSAPARDSPLWSAVACNSEVWRSALADSSIAWTLWSQNAEHWLQQSGVLASDKAERALGTLPRVTSGGHRVANMQCVAERQLRRRIRRLDEALVLSHKRCPIPPGLLAHIFQGAVADEKQAVHQRRWGDARAKAKMRLSDIIQVQQREAISKWRSKVHTLTGACKWLRQEMATPYVLKDEQGCLISSKPVPSLGSFRFGNLTWDTSSPFAFADQCAHGLRDFWRLTAFQRWLGSTRRDALIARASGLRVTQQLLSQLRACASSVEGHARQIMCGGLSVEAHRAPLPSSCSCCGHAVVPSTEHILWASSLAAQFVWNLLQRNPTYRMEHDGIREHPLLRPLELPRLEDGPEQATAQAATPGDAVAANAQGASGTGVGQLNPLGAVQGSADPFEGGARKLPGVERLSQQQAAAAQ
eukprot:Skav215264  [mRNA]  locus=scaffold2881:38182:47134:+ [translate_table: standard]